MLFPLTHPQMYTEAAEHAYTALTLQQASEDDDLPGVQNNSLWEILRVSLDLYVPLASYETPTHTLTLECGVPTWPGFA